MPSTTAAPARLTAAPPQRAPRVWHIEQRHGDRFYAVDQYGGFSGWHLDRDGAEQQIADELAAHPEDSRDKAADQ